MLQLDFLPQDFHFIADFFRHFAVWKVSYNLFSDIESMCPSLFSDSNGELDAEVVQLCSEDILCRFLQSQRFIGGKEEVKLF